MFSILTPFDPRPGRPVYIKPTCHEPGCGEKLVLDDELPEAIRFQDEWVCPKHREKVLVDSPISRLS